MSARSIINKPSLLPLLAVVSFTVASSLALVGGRLNNNVEPRTAFKSNSARADEVTIAKAKAIRRRIAEKKSEGA